MTNTYAIAAVIHGRRYYWRRRNTSNTNAGGGWVPFNEATLFSQNQRKAYTLPEGGAWISVLHGIGTTPYPADAELRSN